MNTFTKVAVAAVAVIAVGAVGLAIFRPGSTPGVGGAPSSSPSQSPDPSAPPPLSSSFTSTIHGISLLYPTGWVTALATEPWTSTNEVNFLSPAMDHIYDPLLESSLFLEMASQPLVGKTGDTWVADFLAVPEEGCGSTPSDPVTIDGASGRICDGLAAVSTGDRGYFIRIYVSDDEPWLGRYYDQSWFRRVLDTVQLDPAGAVDAPPSAPASANP